MTSLEVDNVSVRVSVNGTARRKRAGRGRPGKETVEILKDVSVKLRAGDRLAVLGPNGAGKTTLLRVMSRILPPSAGRVRSEGHIIALISKSEGLMNGCSCLENVRLSGLFHGLKGNDLEEYIETVFEISKLSSYRNRSLNVLSTGMRGRLIVSMLMPMRGDILIMDEWIGTGDKMVATGRHALLKNLVSETQIFVLASHREKIVRRNCNKAIFLDGGEIKYFGDVDEALAMLGEDE